MDHAELDDDDADRQDDRDGRPERRAGRGAQHVRIGQRVADQALERGTGDGQGGPDEHRREHPRHPQVPDDRLGRGRPGSPEVEPEGPPQDHPELSAGPIRDRAEPDPDDDAEGESHEHDARDDARAAPQPAGEADRSGRPGHRASGHRIPLGAGGIWMSGQIAVVRCPKPGGQPGTWAGDLDVVDGPDHVVLDGGHHVPARSRGDGRRRRRVERVDAEDDHLRIALDELLQRRSRRCWGRRW